MAQADTKVRPLGLTLKLSVMRCADDVIPAGSVASTASSLGDYHTSYGSPAGPRQRWGAASPACKRGCSPLGFQQLLSIVLMNGSYCCTLSHARPHRTDKHRHRAAVWAHGKDHFLQGFQGLFLSRIYNNLWFDNQCHLPFSIKTQILLRYSLVTVEIKPPNIRKTMLFALLNKAHNNNNGIW